MALGGWHIDPLATPGDPLPTPGPGGCGAAASPSSTHATPPCGDTGNPSHPRVATPPNPRPACLRRPEAPTNGLAGSCWTLTSCMWRPSSSFSTVTEVKAW